MTRCHVERMIGNRPESWRRNGFGGECGGGVALDDLLTEVSFFASRDRQMIGDDMAFTREHPRTIQTEDLSATPRSSRRPCVVGPRAEPLSARMLVRVAYWKPSAGSYLNPVFDL